VRWIIPSPPFICPALLRRGVRRAGDSKFFPADASAGFREESSATPGRSVQSADDSANALLLVMRGNNDQRPFGELRGRSYFLKDRCFHRIARREK